MRLAALYLLITELSFFCTVDGFTEGTMRTLADFPAAFSRLLRATQSPEAPLASGSAEGSDGDAATPREELWSLYCKYNQRMLQHEYSRAVLATAGTSSVAPADVDFSKHRFILLDRAYLAAECGVTLPTTAGTTPGIFYDASAHQPVSTADDEPVKKKLRVGAVRNYRNIAAGIEESDEPATASPEPEPAPAAATTEEPVKPRREPLPGGVGAATAHLRIEPYSFADQLYGQYKREWHRKQG
jgi:hypothetical protein